MITVKVYNLSAATLQFIIMPERATILYITTQDDSPVLYVNINTDNRLERRVFWTFRTGDDMQNNVEHITRKYVGSYRLSTHKETYHLLEDKNFYHIKKHTICWKLKKIVKRAKLNKRSYDN